MTIDIYGGKREGACRDFLLKSGGACGFSSAVVLPIPSSRDGVYITGTTVPLASLLSGGGLIAGYGLPRVFIKEAEERGISVVDVKDDEEFTEENARLTAECTLAYIMNKSDVSARELCVCIVGYGRIGRTLAEMLLFFGTRVTVITRRESVKMELLFSGVDASLVAEAELSRFDLVINTAPARLFSKKQCEAIRGAVLELAPGENLDGAQNLTRLPSLPAKMLPISGGKAYAAAILRAISEMEKCK